MSETKDTEYGETFIVRGEIVGPDGRAAQVATIWIGELGEATPRLVTAYPD